MVTTRTRLLALAACLVANLAAAGGRQQPAASQGDERAAGRRDPRIEQMLSQVSQDRVNATLERLGSFVTRNTLSSTESTTTGIGAARQWIFQELTKASPRLQVSFDTYQVPKGGRMTRDVELRNVVAILPGRSPRRIYVSAHYDTVSLARRAGAGGAAPQGAAERSSPPSPAAGVPAAQGADTPAPGVNDDGSGTALVIELARVMATSGIDFDATMVFVAFAGEEQGLVGAQLHARKAAQEHQAIDAVLNNDMVGNVRGGDGLEDSRRVRVFSESPEDSPSRQLARYVAAAAARYVPAQHVALVARYDRFGRGGDHTPFNQEGFAAVRITEAVENYERQHTPADTAAGIDLGYLLRNVRVNVAAAASLALAPPAPVTVDDRGQPTIGRQPSGYDANLRWKASPGAASYKVYWRTAWTPDWQHSLDVGNVSTFVLPDLSIDDYVFGVAAVGADGNESLVSAYVNPARRPVATEGR